MKAWKTLTIAAALLTGAGCHSYEDERPPVDSLDSRDRGLQSKDVVDASDQMAASILGDSDINARPDRMLLVVDNVYDKTSGGDARGSLDIFLERVKVQLAQKGRGRIQLIENRDKLHQLQSQELEPTGGDQFGQGGGTAGVGPAGLQPDYSLTCTITDLPNRGTNYYYFDFGITGLKGAQARQIVWANGYEVRVAR